MSFLFWIALFAISPLALQGQGVIEGTVATAGTATPISGAKVRLRTLDPRNSDMLIRLGLAGGNREISHDSGLRTISETTTDGAGRFFFRDVSAGSFTIEASLDGFVANADSQSAVSAIVVVAQGQRVQAPPLVLIPASTILGRVVNNENQPLVDAVVLVGKLVTGEDGRKGLQARNRAAQTDATGSYRFPNLAPGEYYVSAGVDFEGAYFPGVSDLVDALPVVAKGSSEAIADIRFPPPRTGPTFKVSGMAVRPSTSHTTDTDPLHGEVWLEDRNSNVRVRTRGQEPGLEIRLTDDGRFELTGVRPGSYMLYVNTIEWPSVPPGPPPVFSKVPVDIQDKDLENMVVVLQPGVEVKGRVRVLGDPKGIEFRVGDSVDPVHVTLVSRHGFGPDNYHPNRTTRGDGASFAYSNVPEGNYDVLVYIPLKALSLHPDAYVEDIRADGTSLFDSKLQVGTRPIDLEVVIGTTGGSIEGAISSKSKDSPTMLILVPDYPRRGDTARYRNLVLPESGEFRLRGIAPGMYRIFAVPGAEGTVPFRSSDFIARHELLALRVTVRNGDSLTGLAVPYFASAP